MIKKVYMACDYADEKAEQINSCPNIGVEHLGHCDGRILHEDGSEIGRHHSSTFGFLRADLLYKLKNKEGYEVVDLIGAPVPERFKRIN